MDRGKIILRGRNKPYRDAAECLDIGAKPLETLDEILKRTDADAPEAVIAWHKDDRDKLAALDIDFHTDPRPDRGEIKEWFKLDYIKAHPDVHWITHGNGLRGIFGRSGNLNADERAACYAAHFIQTWRGPKPTFYELKNQTRHPEYPDEKGAKGSTPAHGGTFDLVDRVIRRMALPTARTEADEAEVEAWLKDRGFTQGGRYPHEHCPIEPGPCSGQDPVIILDDGVFCHRCEGKGVTALGMRKAGFVPWARLIEDPTRTYAESRLSRAVRGKCHWTQARHIVAHDLNLRPPLDEQVYLALLKAAHLTDGMPDDLREANIELLKRVFKDIRLVRSRDGLWIDSTGLAIPATEKQVSTFLKLAPALMYVGKEDLKTHTDPYKLMNFSGHGDLTADGYAPVKIYHGVDYGWPEWSDLSKFTPVVKEADPPFHHFDDVDMRAVEEAIRHDFPGVRLDVLKLLIAAKGIAQKDPQEPPTIFFRGVTGAAKSAHVRLAAQLCCDSVRSIDFTVNQERFKAHFADAISEHGFVFIDEIDKVATVANELARGILSLTRDSGFHMLYAGNRQLRQMPVLCLADTKVPAAIVNDRQLARRIMFVDLGNGIGGVDWRTTCHGGEITEWRKRTFRDGGSQKAHLFGDMLTSFIMKDAFVPGVRTTFNQIAKHYGFSTFAEGGLDDLDLDKPKKNFAKAICEAPESNAPRFPKEGGWKIIHLDRRNEPLYVAMVEALANGNIEDEKTWQELSAFPWAEPLGNPDVVLDLKTHGRTIAVRLRAGVAKSPNVLFNGLAVEGFLRNFGSCQEK